jgi:hypothetical protein
VGKADVSRYLYWSDRRIRSIAADNGIPLTRSWSFRGKTPDAIAGVSIPQVEFNNTERQERNRREIAQKLSRAIGDQVVVTFDSPPPARFASGVGTVNFARFIGGPAGDKGVLLHIRTACSSGEQVDLVLFGSMDNVADFRRSDAVEDGWTSSAWYAISQLLESRGTRNTSQWDDPQSLSVEALKIALDQGMTFDGNHAGRPWTRGFTLGHAEQCEWLAVIYTDVVLDQTRWDFRDDSCAGASRILIGAPMWVRTGSPSSVVRYGQLRRNGGTPPGWWQRFLPGRQQSPSAITTSLPDPPALPAGREASS